VEKGIRKKAGGRGSGCRREGKINDISSPDFGEITEALPGREVQLALKFYF
jgi:hypothetical protein